MLLDQNLWAEKKNKSSLAPLQLQIDDPSSIRAAGCLPN